MNELDVIYSYMELDAEARTYGLSLTHNRIEFLLRCDHTRQLHASARTLAEVRVWVQRRRRTSQVSGLQRVLQVWPPRSVG